MPATLTTAKAQLTEQLSDLTNLVWSSTALEETLRESLAELSKVYGEALSLNGLDGAVSTTFDELDTHVLISGGLAYAIRFRVMGRFEEASHEDLQPEEMARWAEAAMNKFQSELTQVRMRRFQETSDHPYSPWEWEEGRGFL
jgi:hypothetical protein